MVYTDKQIWLDSESNVTDRNINDLRKNETVQEDYSRFSDNEKMEKEPAINMFLEILLNKRLGEVDAFLASCKNDIDAREKALYILLIVLFECFEVLQKVVEIIDENAAKLKGIESLNVYELPENIDLLFDETPEREELRRTAFKEAINHHRNFPIIEIMKIEGRKIMVNDEDIVQLGLVDNELLYHAVENKLKIKRK